MAAIQRLAATVVSATWAAPMARRIPDGNLLMHMQSRSRKGNVRGKLAIAITK